MIIFAAAWGALPVAAALAACPSDAAEPALTVTIGAPPVIYRLDETAATLAARASENGTALGRGRGLLGLTVNRYDVHITVVTENLRADGAACARLHAAQISVVPATEVLVDHRFAAGTCQRQAILDHENQHVAIYRNALAQVVPAAEAAIRQALPPALAATPDQPAEGAYARLIQDALDPVLAAVRARAQDGNSSIDTAESYASVFRRCPSW